MQQSYNKGLFSKDALRTVVKDTFLEKGYDKDGYKRNGRNATGYDRNGFDVLGFDRDGYSLDGGCKINRVRKE